MTLDELNSAVATATSKPKSEASKAVAAVLHGIQDALSKGDKVSIAGSHHRSDIALAAELGEISVP